MTSLVESFYGLKKPPFTVNESSGPVFMTEPLRAAARFLRAGLEDGTAIQCVSGPRGIGKSSLARALPKLCGGDYHLAVMSGRVTSWDDLRRMLLREFGISQDRITRDGLEEARAKLGKLLIVIDDAHFLSPELLERVCILPQLRTPEGESITQVVMLADIDTVECNRVRPLLAWLEENGHHAMTALEPSETHAYLDTRLRRVGWTGHPLINETGATALHRLALGSPHRLSELGTQLLEYAASRGATLIDAEFAMSCLGAEKCEAADEALAAAPGTELCDEDILEVDDDWEASLAASPLTAENISAAPSLELDVDHREPQPEPVEGDFPESPPLESIRAVYRPPAPPKLLACYRPARGGNHRTLVLLVCIAVTAVVYFSTSRDDLALLFSEFGMPFSFAAERIDEIDRVGGTNAARIETFDDDATEKPDLSSVLYDELSQAAPEAEPTETLALVADSPAASR